MESSRTLQCVASTGSNLNVSASKFNRGSYTIDSITPFNWLLVSLPKALNVLGNTAPAKNFRVSPFIALESPLILISLLVFQLISSAISSKPGPPDQRDSSNCSSKEISPSIVSKVL